MIIRYHSHQDKFDAMNGQTIEQSEQLSELLDRRRSQRPFVAEISGDNGFQLTFGIGTNLCCVQHSHADGSQPYLMAVSPNPSMSSGYVEFLSANTPTPIAARYIISFDELKQVAQHFLQTGERSNVVSWQVLDPMAIEEDAQRTAD
jgi:hypothetical protein